MFAYALCISDILSTGTNIHFQAGIVIAQEAGGLIRGSPSTLDDANWFTEEFLWGRKYIVVRCIILFTDPGITRRQTIVFTKFCIDLFLTRQYEPTLNKPPGMKSNMLFREHRRKLVAMHNCELCGNSMTQLRIGPQSSHGRLRSKVCANSSVKRTQSLLK